MIPQIPVKIAETARCALETIGRTEDVRFSPDNQTLALAGFKKKCCLLLRIDVRPSVRRPRVVITDSLEVVSPGISLVHGLDFLDDHTLAIANRDGFVSLIELPPPPWQGRTCEVAPRLCFSAATGAAVHSPGSVAVLKDAVGNPLFLTCENFAHHVSRHEIDPHPNCAVKTSRVLFSRGLSIPDGIAVSQDGRWIAVSSHDTKDVKIFDVHLPGGVDTEAAGVLSRAGYPHGLRFTSDDQRIIVADAGDPWVHIYERGESWQGEHFPARSVPVISEEAFERGRFDPKIGVNLQEGGPKGIDIDKTGSVLVATCEEQPLAVFALSEILGRQPAPMPIRLGKAARWPWKLMTDAIGKLARAASSF
jgi:hypothetical protein